MRTQAILGIDAGTTAVKSVLLSPDGQLLGMARSTTHILRPRHNLAEQDMEEVWRAVVTTITAALEEAGAVQLIGACVTGQGDGAWLVSKDGRPTGPARLWLDGRGASRASRWRRDGRAGAVRKVTGSALFAGALPILLEEIEAENPDEIAQAVAHLNCKDWLRFRLTGQMATDPTEASRGYLDISTGLYSEELFADLGHERFRRLMPPLMSADSVGGTVTAEAARETGLPEGLPVATGMVDTAAGGIGLGAVEPGAAYGTLGTTGFIGTLKARPSTEESAPIITLSFGESGRVLECLAPMNGTPNLEWAREITGKSDLTWDQVEDLVLQTAPGSNGVLYLPYASTSGERAPFVDPDASASWHNMSVTTTPGQLLRAVYEGIASSLRECIDALHVPDGAAIRLSGGGAQSAAMCQILADTTQRMIERSSDPELGARGAAALALSATGVTSSLFNAVDRLQSPMEKFHPAVELSDLYAHHARVFAAVRDANQRVWGIARTLRKAA